MSKTNQAWETIEESLGGKEEDSISPLILETRDRSLWELRSRQ